MPFEELKKTLDTLQAYQAQLENLSLAPGETFRAEVERLYHQLSARRGTPEDTVSEELLSQCRNLMGA